MKCRAREEKDLSKEENFVFSLKTAELCPIIWSALPSIFFFVVF